MNIVISTEGFWRSIARFAWRRLAKPGGPIPDGVPGIRDRDAICSGYSPRARKPGDWECDTDGHYLCIECAFEYDRKGEPN